jgi:hypothetical protein
MKVFGEESPAYWGRHGIFMVRAPQVKMYHRIRAVRPTIVTFSSRLAMQPMLMCLENGRVYMRTPIIMHSIPRHVTLQSVYKVRKHTLAQ